MHPMRRAAAPLILLLPALAAGCGRLGPRQADLGRFEGSVFVHDGFGMRLPFPADWTIVPREAAAEVEQAGRRALTGGATGADPYSAGGSATSRTLFTVYRYPLGSGRGLNPSLIGGLEDVATRPQVRTPIDYLQMMQSFLGRGGTPMRFDAIVPSTLLGGQEFAVMPATVQPGPQPIGQIYYSRRIGDQMLTIIATFATPEHWSELEPVLAGLTMSR